MLWEASYSGTLKTLNLREAEIKSIPDSAFYHADVQGDPAKGGFKPIKLKHLILPQKITKILSYAFYGVPLESVNWDDTEIAWIYEYAFTYNKLRSVRLPHWDFNVFDYAFAFSDVEEVYLYGPYSLGKSAFEGCKNLKSICLPLTMYAQEKIFYDCDIREVILPPNTAYYNISKHYLGNNKNLHSLKFDSECHIHEYAFEGCDIESIIFDAPMQLGTDSFKDLPTLKQIYCTTTEPPRTFINYGGWFEDKYYYYYPFGGTTPKDIPVYVPKGCADTYRNTPGWDYFTNFIETDNFPTSADMVIGSKASDKTAIPVSGGIRLYPDTDCSYAVYNLGGMLIASGKAEGGMEQTVLCETGVYIVRVGDKSVKVKVE